MKKAEITIKKGIDINVGAKLIDCAMQFQCKIFIEKESKRMRAKSLMSVLSLSLVPGDKISIFADGDDEERAIDLLTKAFNTSFMNPEVINEIKGGK